MKNILTSIADHSDYLSASTYSDSEKWKLHRKRVRFGKQPLEIWMFIPCKLVDGVWIPLNIPKKEYYTRFPTGRTVVSYEKAKDRVLFEGFYFLHPSFLKSKDLYIVVTLEENVFKFKYLHSTSNTEANLFEIKKIEDIAKYNPELTLTALKKIGYE